MMTTEPTCAQRWAEHKNSRFSDLRRLWRAYESGKEDVPDLGNLYEYGLSFDYVEPGTFGDQPEGYWRYQLSWGGPSDEIRFYSSSPSDNPYRIEYWFLDWYDGKGRALVGRDLGLARSLWQWFVEAGSTQSEFDKARAA